MKNTEYKKIVILLGIGEKIVENLKHNDGYNFCKYALNLCWEWIEDKQDVIEKMYDCLDSPDEIDFTYYEDVAEEQNEKNVYRNMFNILAYVTKRVSIINKIEKPQYLDYISEDFYDEFIKDITSTYNNIDDIIDKMREYCDNQNFMDINNIQVDIKRLIRLP